MKLRIEIDLGNAIFEDEGVDEVARLLASVSERLPSPLEDTNGKLNLHDASGNRCGFAEIIG